MSAAVPGTVPGGAGEQCAAWPSHGQWGTKQPDDDPRPVGQELWVRRQG